MKTYTDKMMDESIAKVLRTGVVLSAVIVLLGGILYLRHPFVLTANYDHFIAQASSLRSVLAVLRGVAALDARSVIHLGILCLIATPVARVALCIVGFLRQRDFLYVVISSSVFLILIYSLFRGGR